MRTFSEIMCEVKKVWAKPYFGAVPYIDALSKLDTSDKNAKYFLDDAQELVLYFLSNAQSFRGADARRIKAELRSIIYE